MPSKKIASPLSASRKSAKPLNRKRVNAQDHRANTSRHEHKPVWKTSLHKGILSHFSYKNIFAWLRDAAAGKNPDPSRLVRGVSHPSIKKARVMRYKDGSCAIAFLTYDKKQSNYRIVDPETYAAMLLLVAPGGSFRFNSNGRKASDKVASYYPTLTVGKCKNLSLLRIITNAPPMQDVFQRHKRSDDRILAGTHRDLRRHNLFIGKAVKPSRGSERGRQDIHAEFTRLAHEQHARNPDYFPDHSILQSALRTAFALLDARPLAKPVGNEREEA